MDKGIVGWVCTHNQTLNIPDAYQDERFNPGVDQKTGYKTTSILCSPIVINVQTKEHPTTTTHAAATTTATAAAAAATTVKMVGLIQVINKNGSDQAHFTKKDEIVLQNFCSSISHPVDKVQKEDLTGDALIRTIQFLRKQMAIVRKSIAQLHATAASSAAATAAVSTTDTVHNNSDDSDNSDPPNPSGNTILTVTDNGEQINGGLLVQNDDYLHGGSNSFDTTLKHPRRQCRFLCCYIPCCCSTSIDRLHEWSSNQILHLTKKPIVYFTKDDSPEELNTAIRYMLSNEQRRWIKFVRVFPNEESLPKEIPSVYTFLGKIPIFMTFLD